MDYNYLSKLYNALSAYTTEWFMDMLRLAPGQKWSTTYRMVPISGFKSLVHGSPRVLADLKVERTDKEMKLTHLIAATDKELPASSALVKIFTLDADEPIWQDSISIPPVHHKPIVLSQAASGIPEGHLIVRVKLKGQDIDERYELLVAKTNFSLLLNPVRVYQAERPPKQKVFLKPKEMRLLPHQGRRVLFVKGPYYRFFHLYEALAKIPDVEVKSSWLSASMWSDNTISYFPSTYEEMFGYDLVILANIDAAALPDFDQEMLKDYVKTGGGLLILGGFYSFGNGNYKESRLSDILPVKLSGPFDLKPTLLREERRPQPVHITPVEGALTSALEWQDAPAVLWYHHIDGVNEGAMTIAKAGNDPLIVMGTFGRGSVALVLAAPLGNMKEGQLAFWDWSDWQGLMANIIMSIFPKKD